jgi:hypothetical protein
MARSLARSLKSTQPLSIENEEIDATVRIGGFALCQISFAITSPALICLDTLVETLAPLKLSLR